MTMPLPILLATVVLIGWPAVQIVTSLALRGKRAHFAALVSAMRRDPAYKDPEQEQIDGLVANAKGGSEVITMPVVLPFFLVAFILGHPAPLNAERLEVETVKIRRETAEIRALLARQDGKPDPRTLATASDRRFEEAESLSEDIRFLRWPVSLALLAVVGLATSPFILFAYGLNLSAVKIAKLLAYRFSAAMRLGAPINHEIGRV